MADKAWSGNVGEWGELYAACAILGAGQVSIAERAAQYALVSLQRPEADGPTKYVVEREFIRNDTTQKAFSSNEYAQAAESLRKEILNRTVGRGAFTISIAIQNRLSDLGFTKISAGSTSNADLRLEVRDPERIDPILLSNYSIKTELGARPTLYNMSTGRHLVFQVRAKHKELEKLAQAVNGGGEGRAEAIARFAQTGPVITPRSPSYPHCFTGEKVVADFRGLDGDAPELIAWAVLESYFGGHRDCAAAADAVAKKDPLGGLGLNAYQRKFAQIWGEFARGIGRKDYSWSDTSLGGVLLVKRDFSIEAVPVSSEFGGNLLSRTFFEEPGFGKFGAKLGVTIVRVMNNDSGTLTLPWQVRWKVKPSSNSR
jgi:hypothetical protein